MSHHPTPFSLRHQWAESPPALTRGEYYRAVEQRNRPLTWGSIELRLPQWPT